MEAKKPWLSKTILINAVLGLIAVVAMFLPEANVVSDYIKSHVEMISLAWAALNILLRFITKDKISLQD